MCVQDSTAWTFLSTYESFATDDYSTPYTHRCIGNCVQRWGTNMCTMTWTGDQTTCIQKQTEETRTLRYRTQYNKACKSSCDDFGGYGYQWCALSDTDWGKCSRNIALKANRTHESSNQYTTCVDECAKRDYKYYWCNVANNKWDYCDPDAITHTFDYPTEDGSVCASRCKLYNSDEQPFCYTVEGNWERCFLNPTYDDILNEISINLHEQCPFGEYDQNMTGYTIYGLLPSHHPRKRAADDANENELYFDCDADVQFVANRHRANNPTVTIRYMDPQDIITRDRNPILSYTVLPTLTYFSGQIPRIDLPLVVEALITTHTLAPIGERDRFPNRVDRNYNGMDRNLYHLNYDERGHILASRLGGPMETFNVFPQPWETNRGSNSMWFGLEEDLDRFIRGHDDRYALFTAVLSYATDDDHVLVHRPNAIMLRVRAYANGQMVHIDKDNFGKKVTKKRPNKMENMYFSNHPDHKNVRTTTHLPPRPIA